MGAVLAASVVVGIGASRAGVPALVAFLVLGMLLGSEGPGGIEFDDPGLARTVGVIGLAAILYEGGLSTSWPHLRAVVPAAAALSTVGVAVTALLTGAVARLLFDLGWVESILLGSVVASTDAAAVFSSLRFSHVRKRLARTLEGETGANDPVAIALTLGLIAWLQDPTFRVDDLLLLIVRQLGIGLAVGLILGFVAARVLARLPAVAGPFAPAASVAAAAIAFGSADTLHGSGFLSVYIVGLAVGSTTSPHTTQLVAFHEGVAYLAQVVMFVVLGLLVFPSELPAIVLPGLGLAAVLALVVRPTAVWLSTIGMSFRSGERVFLGWAGLRGAVPIVLGTFVLSEPVDARETIFNAVFFVVLVSALVQGTTLEPVATRLGLLEPPPPTAPAPLEVNTDAPLLLLEFDVTADDAVAGVAVRDLGLPRASLIAVVARGERLLPPRGSTTINPGDRLYVLTPDGTRPALEDAFRRWRRRP